MNTDKIYAESIANEYAKKDEKKSSRLKNSIKKQNARRIFSPTRSE